MSPSITVMCGEAFCTDLWKGSTQMAACPYAASCKESCCAALKPMLVSCCIMLISVCLIRCSQDYDTFGRVHVTH